MSVAVKRSFWGLAGLAGLALAGLLASGCLAGLFSDPAVAYQALDRADAVAAQLSTIQAAAEGVQAAVRELQAGGATAPEITALGVALGQFTGAVADAAAAAKKDPAPAPAGTNWADIVERLFSVLVGAFGGGSLIAARRNRAAGGAAPAIPDAQPSPGG